MSVLCYPCERGPRYGFQISWHFCLIWFELAVNHYGLMSSAIVALRVLCLLNSNEISWKSWLTIMVWWELQGMHCNSIWPAWCLAQSWFLFWLHCLKLSLFDCLVSLKISCEFATCRVSLFLACLPPWLCLFPQDPTDLTRQFEGYKTRYYRLLAFFQGWKQQGLGMNVWFMVSIPVVGTRRC